MSNNSEERINLIEQRLFVIEKCLGLGEEKSFYAPTTTSTNYESNKEYESSNMALYG